MTLRNLITDIPGLRVGHAGDAKLASGTTAVIFDEAVVASVDVRGGGPGTRETALLDPAQTVEGIDAIVLSGGSAFGLDAASGVQAWLREQGRGFRIRDAVVPIVPAAIMFDLLNGGDKNWGRYPPFREFGYEATKTASAGFALGSAGAGLGATTFNFKGGVGTASAQTRDGVIVGALVVVNAVGSTVIGDGPHFWAAPFEQNKEFGGRGSPARSLAIRSGAARQRRTGREHDHRGHRNRRPLEQSAVQSPGGDGARRVRARDLSGPYPARRRCGVRRRDRRQSAQRCSLRAGGARHGRGQCNGARHRARRLRGERPALRRQPAELEG